MQGRSPGEPGLRLHTCASKMQEQVDRFVG